MNVKMDKFRALVSLISLMALLGVGQSEYENYIVTGQVFCDTCHAGFVTRVSTYISGAKVAVECKDHVGKRLSYNEGVTDANGSFRIRVDGEHVHDICEAKALSSPAPCDIPAYTNVGPVFLTHNNGIGSNERTTGPFGFKSTSTVAACAAVMSEYTIYDESD